MVEEVIPDSLVMLIRGLAERDGATVEQFISGVFHLFVSVTDCEVMG